MTLAITIPLRLVSTANAREHWAPKAKRARFHRFCACMSLWPLKPLPSFPVEVRITRIGSRPLDSDNLAASAKSVRDGIADALGVNDADPRVRWVYGQEKARSYGVRIEIESC